MCLLKSQRTCLACCWLLRDSCVVTDNMQPLCDAKHCVLQLACAAVGWQRTMFHLLRICMHAYAVLCCVLQAGLWTVRNTLVLLYWTTKKEQMRRIHAATCRSWSELCVCNLQFNVLYELLLSLMFCVQYFMEGSTSTQIQVHHHTSHSCLSCQ